MSLLGVKPSTTMKCKLMQSLWKTVWRLLKKVKVDLPPDPAIPLLGIYLDKTIIQKNTCIHVFIANGYWLLGLLRWRGGKEICLPMQETQEMWVQSLSQEDPME